MRPLITLLTDFGTADGYVAEMKGVILTRAPDVHIMDISHDITAQDVTAARMALARYWRRFPEGTVHVAVVDPGVGSARRALAVSSDGRRLVGPDNGLLSPALLYAGSTAVSLHVPEDASPTFHGRDVFAPAAALLALGSAVTDLGPEVQDPVILRTPEPHREKDGSIRGEVLTVDRFGNAVTNIPGRREGEIQVAGEVLPLRRTYADVAQGEPAAITGSTGFVEIAVRGGSAARKLGLDRGTEVVLRPGGAPAR